MFIGLTLLAIVAGLYAGLPAEHRGLNPRVALGETDDQGVGWRLLVFETAACGWCVKFRRDRAPGYLASPYQSRAPLTYLNPQAQASYQLSGRVSSTPTFVLVNSHGREIARQRGYLPRDDQFYAFLDKHL